ncbi:MAG TPA: DUF3488 and transglutaminase-like domain-containing protein [Egicoccus sp.]|nr:DUF3488 and transglutaminase-like domain-containing protein [Egicoccus sp.]HSK22341.1 DUF3488 and transglutaminase-like domain-containing protein [Egicoccus sp.]
MNRRAAALGAAALLVVLTTLPAYDRVFTEAVWRGPALLAALLAVGAAAALRAVRVPWWAALLVSLAGLAMFTYLLHLPPGPLLPGGEQWTQVRDLFGQALVEIRETPSPAPVLPGMLLVLTSGYWVVAHLTHELLVRWRSAGLGLVPALVLWSVPLAIRSGQGGVAAAVPFLASACLVLLLSAPDALPGADRLSRVTSSGVAVGALAVVAAVMLPGVLPGYGSDGWVDIGDGGDPRGYQPIVDVAERLKLPEERDVLRVRSEQRSYLRLAGLDSFDGFTWRLGPPSEDGGSYRPDPSSLYSARDVLPPEAEAANTEPVFVDVEVLDLENIYVPAPYQPVQVLGPTRDEMVWSTEGGFLATWDTVDGDLAGEARVGIREGVTYRVQASRPSPTYEDLRPITADAVTDPQLTALPRDYEALREQAEQVYAAAGAQTMVDRALALQEWFIGDAGGFTYDLDVPALRGDQALERFVLEDKLGYCEYFATGMAVMLRATGIPARVAVGFLPGRLDPADPEAGREVDEYTVSTRDAHAWVEVLFPGYGWISFEPTPRDDSSQMVPRADDLTPVENELERTAREARENANNDDGPGSNPQLPGEIPLPDEDLVPPQAGSADAGTQPDETRVWPLALLAMGLAVVAVTVVRGQRARVASVGGDPASRVLTAQRRLLATAASYGLVRRPSETTPEVMARWQREGRLPSDGERFAGLAQRAAFGGDVDGRDAAVAEDLAERCIDALRASVDTRGRLFAPVRVPVSTSIARTRDVVGAVRERLGG